MLLNIYSIWTEYFVLSANHCLSVYSMLILPYITNAATYIGAAAVAK